MAASDRHILHRYDSVPELVAHVQATSDPHGASHEYGSGFYGTDNFDQAIDLALNGWDAVRPDVDAILEPVREKLAEKLDYAAERMHDIVGVEPDIDRYLDGELECMYEDFVTPQPTKGKVFTLLISTSVLGSVDASLVFKRGAAIVALVEAFQMLGCDLTIYVENSCRSSTANDCGVYTVLTKVHTAGENLDINNLMFPLGHPSFQRRVIFGHREGNPQVMRQRWGFTAGIGGGMGRTVAPICDEIVDASFVLAQQPNRHSDEVMDPVQWVLDQLEVQGVYTPHEVLPGAGA